MDQVEVIVSNVVYRRAALVEQFLVSHVECWPGATRMVPIGQTLSETVKCSCGAQLEVVILTKLVISSYQPK
jgi:hypothetical protein